MRTCRPCFSEAIVQICPAKKVFLKISQNSQENTCAKVSFFNKVAGLGPAALLKKRLWRKCLPVNYVEFLLTFFKKYLLETASVFSTNYEELETLINTAGDYLHLLKIYGY